MLEKIHCFSQVLILLFEAASRQNLRLFHFIQVSNSLVLCIVCIIVFSLSSSF